MARSIQAAILIFIVGTVLACISSGRWLLNGEINIINALNSFNVMAVQTGGIWGVPKYVIDFFSALITALTWDYPFLASPFAIVVKIPLWIVSIGVVYGMIELAISVAQGLVGTLRRVV